MWGTTGVGYNEARSRNACRTRRSIRWTSIFKPEIAAKFKDCGIYVLDSPEDILPVALNYLGLDPEHDQGTGGLQEGRGSADEDPALHQEVPLLRIHQRARQRRHLHGARLVWRHPSGGDRATDAKNGQVIKYHIPKEGTQMWFDMMAIPADAKHVEEAHIFLNYLNRPEVMAKASNFVQYANGNLASQKFIDEEYPEEPGGLSGRRDAQEALT